MFRRFSINFSLLSILADGVIVIVALAAANNIRPLLNVFSFAEGLYKPTVPGILFPVFAIVWILIFLLLSVYDGRKNLYAADEFASLTLGSLLAAVSLAGLLYFSYRDVYRLLFVVFILIAFTFMLVWRIIVRLSFNLRRTNAIQNRRVLIIGAGPVGRDLEDRIAQNPYAADQLMVKSEDMLLDLYNYHKDNSIIKEIRFDQLHKFDNRYLLSWNFKDNFRID